MKYGQAFNNKTSKPIKGYVKEFKDEEWDNIMKLKNNTWKQLPKEKVFISFNESDRKRMQILKNRLKTSELVEPVIVEDKRKGNIQLAELITQSLNECKYIIPILSNESIKTQWINQEIGFAQGVKKLQMIPIVQSECIKELKGFIHDQQQLSYQFEITNVTGTDNIQFGKVSNQVLQLLESKIKNRYKL